MLTRSTLGAIDNKFEYTSRRIEPTLHKILATMLLLLVVLLTVSCNKDDDKATAPVSNQVTKEYKVAVIYPLERHNGHMQEALAWAVQTLQTAQSTFDTAVSIQIEWYDEDKEDLEQLADDLRLRPDIMAVIGPLSSEHVSTVGNVLKRTKKTLIAPCATSAELIREFSEKRFFWALVESDVTQCEILLSRAKSMGAKSVSLLVCDNAYGKTFVDWFAFQATELGLQIKGLYPYEGRGDIAAAIEEAFGQEKQLLVCVPSDVEDAGIILKYRDAHMSESPYLLFSDAAYSPNLLEGDIPSEFCEGITPSVDPTSAFEIAYRVHFMRELEPDIAQYYDALILSALAICNIDAGRFNNMFESIKDIVATKNDDGSKRTRQYIWGDEGIYLLIKELRKGSNPYNIIGATGPLDFDSELMSTVVHSVYAHWMVYNRQFITLNYLSSDGSHRTEASLASWNWAATVNQWFEEEPENVFSYPALQGNWALLVAASESWKNYRHQADVLSIYQILKANGYDDDHIILIMKDDIANNPQNPHPGQVLNYNNVNLYTDVHIDYNLDDIQADDIELILSGQSSSRLPTVINASGSDNVLVFWSGHGEQGSMLMAERGEENGLTTDRMTHLLTTMRTRQCYRKMLWLIETCYSGSIGLASEMDNYPGVLMLTAASPFETSKASGKVDGIYRTNRFTELLTNTITTNPNITYRNLYYALSTQTVGSHVMMYNANHFDNIVNASPNEFLFPVGQ